MGIYMDSARVIQYLKDLKASGVPEEQAEAQLIALENMLQGLATKSELLAMKNELLDKIDTRLDKIEGIFDGKLDKIDTRLDKIEGIFDGKLDKIEGIFDGKLDKAVNNLKWFVVYVVAGTFAVSFIFPVVTGLVVNAVSKWIGKI